MVVLNKESAGSFIAGSQSPVPQQQQQSNHHLGLPKLSNEPSSNSAFQLSEESTSQSFWASEVADHSSGTFSTGHWGAPPRTPSYYAAPPPPPPPPVAKRSWMPPPPPPRRLVEELNEEGRPDPTGCHYRIFLRWYSKTHKVEHNYVPDSHRCPARGGNYSFEEWCFLADTWWKEHFAHLQQRPQRK